jgi:hypothetical protein
VAGDFYPVTNGGRFVGAFLMITGVALFGVIAAFVANLFLSARARKATGTGSEIQQLRDLVLRNEELASEIHTRLDRLEATMRSSGGNVGGG